MAIQSTPHTESQQNKSETETELTPTQIADRMERDGKDGLYANTDGAQMGTNRSEHVTDVKGQRHKVEPGASAETGARSTEIGRGEGQGVTNHSQQAEYAGQKKVMEAREADVLHIKPEDTTGEPERNSVSEGGSIPARNEAKVETVEVSAMRSVK